MFLQEFGSRFNGLLLPNETWAALAAGAYGEIQADQVAGFAEHFQRGVIRGHKQSCERASADAHRAGVEWEGYRREAVGYQALDDSDLDGSEIGHTRKYKTRPSEETAREILRRSAPQDDRAGSLDPPSNK